MVIEVWTKATTTLYITPITSTLHIPLQVDDIITTIAHCFCKEYYCIMMVISSLKPFVKLRRYQIVLEVYYDIMDYLYVYTNCCTHICGKKGKTIHFTI